MTYRFFCPAATLAQVLRLDEHIGECVTGD